MIRTGTTFAALALLGCWAPASLPAQGVPPDARVDIGYRALEQRLQEAGRPVPTGAGVTLTHIESDESPSDELPRVVRYLPDAEHADFAGIVFVNKRSSSTPPGTSSRHATNMGRGIYGAQGLAPGIDQVETYYADQWVFVDGLRTGTAGVPPAIHTGRVQSHSWVASIQPRLAGQPVNFDEEILKRFDLMLARDGIVAAVGRTEARYPVLGSSWNAISVGVSSKGGDRPLIVAPAGSTSLATAWVAGAVALLVETADHLPDSEQVAAAGQIETIRAVLLAGATKDEPEFRQHGGWSRTAVEPLDPRFGVGELNVDESHRILEAGRYEANDERLLPSTGWDWSLVTPDAPQRYFFEVADDREFTSLSVVATWNRRIDLQRLIDDCANLDLRLYHADEAFNLLGVVGEPSDERGMSLAPDGNVEHLYLTDLPAGRYAIEVTTDRPWRYALAWHAQTKPDPSVFGMAVSGLAGVGLAWLLSVYLRYSRRRTAARPPKLPESLD